MDLKLRVTQGKNVGQEVSVPGKMFLIGRAEDCHFRAGSDLISRHHCVIIIEQDYLAVRDFGSKNGTSVNGERVVGECELKHGDELRVGPLEFVVQVSQGSLGGKKKPPVHDAKEAAARTAANPVDEDPDVTKWLSEPAQTVHQSAQDTQLVRVGDTDEIDVGSTREFGLPEPDKSSTANPPAAKAPAAAQQAVPAPKSAVPAPKSAVLAPKSAVLAPKSVAAGPKPAPAEPAGPAPKPSAPLPGPAAEPAASPVPGAAVTNAAEPAPVAEKKGFFGGGGKKFGKLPTPPTQESKNSVEAASNMLSKFRKRR